VEIEIDSAKRSIRIRDNGTGIPATAFVKRLVAFGASVKRGRSARGFAESAGSPAWAIARNCYSAVTPKAIAEYPSSFGTAANSGRSCGSRILSITYAIS